MLALIGGGEIAQGETNAADLAAFARLGKVRPKVVALPPRTIDQANYGLRLEDHFTRLGADVSTLLLEDEQDAVDAVPALDTADLIYLGGGSLAFYRWLRGTAVHDALQRCAEHPRRCLAGISAGALIANTSYSGEGWSLLPEALGVEVHAQRPGRLDALCRWTMAHPERLGIGLADGAGLLVGHGRLEEAISTVLFVKMGKVTQNVRVDS